MQKHAWRSWRQSQSLMEYHGKISFPLLHLQISLYIILLFFVKGKNHWHKLKLALTDGFIGQIFYWVKIEASFTSNMSWCQQTLSFLLSFLQDNIYFSVDDVRENYVKCTSQTTFWPITRSITSGVVIVLETMVFRSPTTKNKKMYIYIYIYIYILLLY